MALYSGCIRILNRGPILADHGMYVGDVPNYGMANPPLMGLPWGFQ